MSKKHIIRNKHTHLVVNLNQVYQNKQALRVSAGSHFILTVYQWGTKFLISTFSLAFHGLVKFQPNEIKSNKIVEYFHTFYQ